MERTPRTADCLYSDELEEYEDLSQPRKSVQKQAKTQDAIYWINLRKTHDKGTLRCVEPLHPCDASAQRVFQPSPNEMALELAELLVDVTVAGRGRPCSQSLRRAVAVSDKSPVTRHGGPRSLLRGGGKRAEIHKVGCLRLRGQANRAARQSWHSRPSQVGTSEQLDKDPTI